MIPKPTTGQPLAVDVIEAAKLLSVTPKMIRRLIKRQQLKAQKVGRLWYIATTELQRFANGEERKTA
jgi:excisionase family DNA binding protein